MKDGGPAFPQDAYFDERCIGQHDGMSLRDYFAAHCPGDLAKCNVQSDAEEITGQKCPDIDRPESERFAWNMLVEAALRYLYADAMLIARDSERGK